MTSFSLIRFSFGSLFIFCILGFWRHSVVAVSCGIFCSPFVSFSLFFVSAWFLLALV